MLNLKYIINNIDHVNRAMAYRGIKLPFNKLIKYDIKRRNIITKLDELRNKRNKLSMEIAHSTTRKMDEIIKNLITKHDKIDLNKSFDKFKFLIEEGSKKPKDLEIIKIAKSAVSGLTDNQLNILLLLVNSFKETMDGNIIRERVRGVSAKIEKLESQLNEYNKLIDNFLLEIPNLPHASVPGVVASEDNPVVRTWGEPPAFDFTPKAHWEIGEALGILDFERAAKISGARFALLGAGARLERALIGFMLELHTREHGYTEVLPPFVTTGSMLARGSSPSSRRTSSRLQGRDHFLIPTAEVPVTNLHRDEILPAEPCPSILRLHPLLPPRGGLLRQGRPGPDPPAPVRQGGAREVRHARGVLRRARAAAARTPRKSSRLGLHYRVMTLCAGDMGFAAAKTYDLEVWLPGQGLYREISSCSNFEDFQARRANIRFRRPGAKGASSSTR